MGRFNAAEPLRMATLANRLRPNRANYPELVSASAMVGPLPYSNRKNREKPSFGTSEQGFSSHEHLHGSRKAGVFRHFHVPEEQFPVICQNRGLNRQNRALFPMNR